MSHAGVNEVIDADWDELPGWLPMQHFRADALCDVYVRATDVYVRPDCVRAARAAIDATMPVWTPPPAEPPPPRNPALRLVNTGSGMTSSEWRAWLGEWHT